MQMTTYLGEIEHALAHLLDAVWAEHRKVEELAALIDAKTRETEEGYRRAEAWMQEEHPDDYMIGVGEHWNTYFGADKERHAAVQQALEAEQKLAVRQFSRAAMAGSILQYGKQAISIVHGTLAKAPSGRAIGGQSLKDVIWQGRNQSLHWEEGAFSRGVEASFDLLTSDIDAEFGDYRSRNMAFEVVQALGWTALDAVKNDLRSLG